MKTKRRIFLQLNTKSEVLIQILWLLALVSLLLSMSRPPPHAPHTIKKEDKTICAITISEPQYCEDDLLVLAIIIYQEAGGDNISDKTRLMVGNVFLNRVADSRFPNTFREVATQKRQYGTLWRTGVKWPARASKAVEQNAVHRAFQLARLLLDGKRVLPADVIWQAEFKQGTEIYAHKDGIYFCR